MTTGLDLYSVRARWAPAILSAIPALAFGVSMLPLLEGVEKLWSLIGIAVPTFAALVARRAGNRVQPGLWESWGGAPSLSILRFSQSGDQVETERRHARLEELLGGGVRLSTATEEAADPESADARYSSALNRLIGKVRGQAQFHLLNVENRNYGFARNLFGLRTWGVRLAWATLGLAILGIGLLASIQGWSSSAPLLLPATTSAVALIGWKFVDADFVKPSAVAYAARLAETLDALD